MSMIIIIIIMAMIGALCLTQMLLLLSLYVMLSILLNILVCNAASLFGACLVCVQCSAPYVITGNAQKLYIWLFKVAFEEITVFGVLAYCSR